MKRRDKNQVEDVLALTPMQEGILFHYLQDPGSLDYREQLSLEIGGEIDRARFERAWDEVIARNEVLRMQFRWENITEPVQVVLRQVRFKPIYHDFFAVHDIPETAALIQHRQVAEVKIRDREHPFDLSQVPFRVILCRLDRNKHLMIVSFHHILMDGWSLNIVLTEFFRAYGKELSRGDSGENKKTGFKEFVRWIKNQDLGGHEIFWRNYLEGVERRDMLPKSEKKAEAEDEIGIYEVTISPSLEEKISIYLKQYEVTPAVFFFSAWGLLLQRYVDCRDVMFGTTVSGRSIDIKGIERIVGLLINTIPLRIEAGDHWDAFSLFKRVGLDLRHRQGFETSPLPLIKKWAGFDHLDELFQSIVVVENYPLAPNSTARKDLLKILSYTMEEQTHYDITVVISAFSRFEIRLQYRKIDWQPEAMARLSHHFTAVIRSLLERPERSLSQIEILSEEERRLLVEEFNAGSDAGPQTPAIPEWFDGSVETRPHQIAITAGTLNLTFRGLHRQIEILAGALQERGVRRNWIVALSLDRSPEMLIAVLGILRCGGAYLPMDPDYPEMRANFILRDSGARLGLCVDEKVRRDVTGIQWLSVENIGEGMSHLKETADSDCLDSPGDLAYMIYTSGSTGKPKGVLVEQRGVINLLQYLSRVYPCGTGDAYLFKTSYVFDVSVTELFGWFPGGGRLEILDAGAERDPAAILDHSEQRRITHLNFVPSMFNVFLGFLSERGWRRFSSLRYIFLAGEALLPDSVRKFGRLVSDTRLENIYGPTEATVYASKYSLADWSEQGGIPIGKSLDQVQLLILDRLGRLQPTGVAGELYIAGAGLAVGYLNRPELTADWFLFRNPRPEISGFSASFTGDNRRMYRTGDLTRRLPDGDIEFLGRIDTQVKIRGFRIEPGEIESLLLDHPEVKEAVVHHREDSAGERCLVAYVVFRPGSTVGITRLRSYLSLHLPDYMVPSSFKKLSRLPRTPTGKIDRSGLPKPSHVESLPYVPPRDNLDKRLIKLWGELLEYDVRRIGIDNHFIMMGGHSLKVVRLVGRIHRIFSVRIPLKVIFRSLTVRQIADYLKRADQERFISIEAAEKKEYYPISTSQKRFYIFQQMNPQDVSYNMPEIMLVEGEVDSRRFGSVLRAMIRRHDVLRTYFIMIGGEASQIVLPEVTFSPGFIDLESEKIDVKARKDEEGNITLQVPGDIDEKGRTAVLAPLMKVLQDFVRPFDLCLAPLMRFTIVKLSRSKYIFAFDMHHVISDGVSVSLFVKDILRLYAGEELPALRINYKDYCEWDRSRRSANADGEEGSTAAPVATKVLDLPTDYIRPPHQDYAGDALIFKLRNEHLERLKTLAFRRDVTLYMLLLSMFYVFLAKISNQEEIVVGSPIAGRLHPDLASLIGLFINTLTLWNVPSGNKRFCDFLNEVKGNTLEAFENQDYQYEELVERVRTARFSGRNPLFDVMFVLQNMDSPELSFPGMEITRGIIPNSSSKFDLTLYCAEYEGDLDCRFEYSTSLFKESTIQHFAGYFKEIVFSILEEPAGMIGRVEFVPTREKNVILFDFNRSGRDFPGDTTMNRLLDEQAERTPDSVAVGFANELQSYSELHRRADRLARMLRAGGVGPNKTAGIMLSRSLQMMEALVGVMKSGGTYVPIDSQHPDKRILNMLEQSKAKVLLTSREILEGKNLSIESQQIIELDALKDSGPDEEFSYLEPINKPNDLIYIIFTSGSTGNPKGAGVYHRSFINLVMWNIVEFSLVVSDRPLIVTSLSFDLTQKNLYAPLLIGASLYLPAQNYFDPAMLVAEIDRYQITFVNCTPSIFYRLVEFDVEARYKRLSSLRFVFLGGEPILVSKLLPWMESPWCRAELANTYGPTECTDICAFYRVEDLHQFLETPIPVGAPVYNVELFVLDRNLKLLPVGIPGELAISGVGVGIGYVNDEKMTAEKFLDLTLAPGFNRRIYRTGDLVKWLPGGNIEFVGRIDHQVKVRGFRIELGEIEAQLLQHERIRGAVVMAREILSGDKQLCAYYVLEEGDNGEGPDIKELKDHIAGELPGYMIPSFFIRLDEMPLNPNGKVDRKSLPAPDFTANENYVSPENEVQRKMANIWADVLGLSYEIVGIDNNFFELGGHSLKAATLVARIHREFSKKISINEIFDHGTIRGLTAYIDGLGESGSALLAPVEKKEYYPLSSAQKRMFLLHQLDAHSTVYNMPAAVTLPDDTDINDVSILLKRLILRHQSLRTYFELRAGEPVQRISDEVPFEIERLDPALLVGHDSSESSPVPSSDEISRLLERFIRPFVLDSLPLLRAGFIQVDGKNILLYDLHHIVFDGLSHLVLQEEFLALREGEGLPALTLQYRDYAVWQNSEAYRRLLTSQESYWLEIFSKSQPVLNLPTDYSRPPVQSFVGREKGILLDEKLSEYLRRVSRESGTTLFMVILAVYGLWLSRLSGERDLVVGVPVSGRLSPSVERMIGMFVNTLAIRLQPAGSLFFMEYLEEVRQRVWGAFENQDYPFETLVEKLAVERDTGRNPLFDVMLNFWNPLSEAGSEKDDPTTAPGEMTGHRPGVAKFDLTLTVSDNGGGVYCNFQYCSNLFYEETIDRWVGYFKDLITDLATGTSRRLAEMEMLSLDERRRLLIEFNRTGVEIPSPGTIIGLFENQVHQSADRIGIADDHRYWSYREVGGKVGRLGGLLADRGVSPNTLVALSSQRSGELVMGVIAVLWAGGAYLPVEPDYPEDRVHYMLKDSGTDILVRNGHPDHRDYNGCRTLDLNELLIRKPVDETPIPPPRLVSPDNMAYGMYTSGSTGRPRGVLVSQLSVVNLLLDLKRRFSSGALNIRLFKTSFVFDVSITELLGWFVDGGCVSTLPNGREADPEQLLQAILRYRVTQLNLVPSMFAAFVQWLEMEDIRDLGLIKDIILAGEALPSEWVDRFNELHTGTRLSNLYGPTEAAVYASGYRIESGNGWEGIPIGRPLDNVNLLVLSGDNRLQGIGLAGELCISGVGLGRGYLNRPELTAEKFTFEAPGDERRIYRTGDSCRWTPAGDLLFLGRLDRQLKIRGFRIEPGEVERCLLSIPELKEAAVSVWRPSGDDPQLCAYYTADGDLSPEVLQQLLKNKLPLYMVPSSFSRLSEMPLTVSGKVDHRKLPVPEWMDEPEIITPLTGPQRRLARLWGKLLNVPEKKLGPRSHFFKLGGHSLKVISLISTIHLEWGIKVPFLEVFKSPTIAELSRFIDTASPGRTYTPIEVAEKKEYYPLSSAQQRMFILQQMDPRNTGYNITRVEILEETFDLSRLAEVLKQLIRRHDALRTFFYLLDDTPVQRIADNVEFAVQNLTIDSGTPLSTAVGGFVRPFDLTGAPLLRVGLAPQMGLSTSSLLMVDMHHIISDGISLRILLDDFMDLYHQKSLPLLSIQYKDFVEWQNRAPQLEMVRRQEEYWLEEFRQSPPPLTMPLDFPRPRNRGLAGRTTFFSIPANVAGGLEDLAKNHQLTLNMILFAIYGLLVHYYSGLDDIVIGSLVAGRNHGELEHLVGLFINFLPVRLRFDPEATFSEFLGIGGEQILNAYANQDYPFDRLVSHVGERESAARNPMFDTMLVNHTETELADAPVEGDEETPWAAVRNAALLDFKVDLFPTDSGRIIGRLEYDGGLFKEETMQSLIRHFLILLEKVPENPGCKLGDFKIFSPNREQALAARRETVPQSQLEPVDVVVSATFTSEPLAPYLEWWLKKFGWDARLTFAPYNQVFQQLLDSRSLVSRNRGINVLLVRSLDWIRDLEGDETEKSRQLKRNTAEFLEILERKEKESPYFVGIFPSPETEQMGNGLADGLAESDRQQRHGIEKIARVHAVDFRDAASLYGSEDIFDPIKDRIGHIPFTDEYMAVMGTYTARKICGLLTPPLKVIALDCDNTLWRGICGEDGPLGVTVENPYRELQRFMLRKSQEGFLLVLCSKNNETDVRDVFESNPGMELKWDHLAAWRINWRAKSDNLRELAEELNLGIDSFIFLDDSPVECAEVGRRCPEVLTFQLPKSSRHIPLFLAHIWAFDRIEVTRDDRSRTLMYRQERQRREIEEQSTSLDDFLGALKLEVSMNVMEPPQIPRVSQLTMRTNQFNLSTIRRREEEVRELTARKGVECWVLEVWDRFGYYGLTGLVITRRKGKILFIDTLLLSCRVLGRGVEDAILVGLKEHCHRLDCVELEAHFYPTARNRPIRDFLEHRWSAGEDRGEYRVYRCPVGEIDESRLTANIKFHFLKKEAVPSGRSPDEGEESSGLEGNISADHSDYPEGPGSGGNTGWESIELPDESSPHHRYFLPLLYYREDRLLRLPVGGDGEAPAQGPDDEELPDETEMQLKTMWSKVLGMDGISRNAHFFRLGGNSLKAVSLTAMIHRRFDVKITLSTVFDVPVLKQMAALIRESETDLFKAIRPTEEREYYPLAAAQKRFYVMQHMRTGLANNNPMVVRLEGSFDKNLLERALQRLIRRHQVLRTRFIMVEGRPVQRIEKEVPFSIAYFETGNSEGETGFNPQQLIDDFIGPFDLSRAPLMRAGTIKIEERRHILMIDMHHIITDGISFDIFLKEMQVLYAGEEPPPLNLQYRDYAVWQEEMSDSHQWDSQRDFWLERFPGKLPVLTLPTDAPRETVRRFEGDIETFRFDREQTAGLRAVAEEEQTTLFMVMLACYNVLLAKLSGQEDIVVGTGIAGRDHQDLGHIIGLFFNTLPLRNFPQQKLTFREFLKMAAARTLEAFENQNYPFDQLVTDLRKSGSLVQDPTRNPLFDTMFALQNFEAVSVPLPQVRISELQVHPYDYKGRIARFDLFLHAAEAGEYLNLAFEYSVALFKVETIGKIIGNLTEILEQVLANPDIPIENICLTPLKRAVASRFVDKDYEAFGF